MSAHTNAPWITLLGIGEDGFAGLGEAARQAIAGATHLVGSERHLALAGESKAERHPWPTPLEHLFDAIEGWRGEPVVILATGDPMTFGVGKKLLTRFTPADLRVLPAPSAFALAAARLGWPVQDVDTVSLHGRPSALVEPLIAPGNRILALTNDGGTPAEVAARLVKRGFGDSVMTVLENMGGPSEARHDAPAHAITGRTFGAFNTLAVACVGGPDAIILPRIPGLPDGAFRHDGQMTKREVRAATLAALCPAPDLLLWDVGAGCGSIGIEWMRAARNAHAIAFERNAARLEMISANAANLGVPRLKIVPGALPDTLRGEASPDAAFIGGGITETGVFEAVWRALKPGGMLVANTVSLDGEARLLDLHAAHGGDLVRIDISHLERIARMRVMRPRMAVLQWRTQKPW
jgi:precorrin-6Y C5,15-methyltransferase (decarboxylating)